MIKHLQKNLDKSPLKILIISNANTDKNIFEDLLKTSDEYFNIT
jgi:hypothetical protein